MLGKIQKLILWIPLFILKNKKNLNHKVTLSSSTYLPIRAARFAMILKFLEKFFVKLALEDILRQSKLKYQIELKAS